MKYLLFFITIISLTYAYNLRSRLYYEYEFEKYIRKYQKTYSSADEYVHRLQIFADNIDYIEVTNQKLLSYRLGINRFADLSNEEFKTAYLGAKSTSERKHVKKNMLRKTVAESIDWVAEGAVSRVKDQSMCASCYAFTAIGAIESAHYLKTKEMVEYSEQQVVDCSSAYGNLGCTGGELTWTYEYVKDNGICKEEDYPYKAWKQTCDTKCKTAYNITGYFELEQTEEALELALNDQPIGVELYSRPLHFYSGGIIDGSCDGDLDHGVLAVGYGEENGVKYWKLKNSWGESWGENGYFRLLKGVGGLGQCLVAAACSAPNL